jgi:uncharacterized membrane protein
MATKKAVRPKTETPTKKRFSLERLLPYVLIVGSVIGLIASFVLSYDKLKILENPSFVPNCNLNPVLNCGSVMVSDPANTFGFPNPWIGLITFASLLTVGMAMLAGASFKRWFWLALYGGVIAGLAFALYLLFQSIYSINALCPYCLATDVAVFSIFWYTTLYLIEQKHIVLKGKLAQAANFARNHHLDILLLTFIAFIVLILNHFWYYYGDFLK